MTEVRAARCKANGCPLGSTLDDMCPFHAAAEPMQWSQITDYLNSPEGDSIVSKFRENRRLWAFGVEHKEAQLWWDDAVMDTHKLVFEEMEVLSEMGLLPEEVDLNDKFQTLNQLKVRSGYQVWIKDEAMISGGVFFSLEWVCQAYESYLIEKVMSQVLAC